MAKLQIEKGSTNVTVNIFVQDSSSSVGAGLTGLVYNSAGLTCYYVRPLAAAAALSLATQTVTGIHSDGGFVEISSTNTPGLYRLDLSDVICASGVNFVTVELKGAANMVPVLLEIQLTTFDLNDASPEVTLASETHTGAVIPTVTTLTGHTGQTGDSYARLGAPAAASIAADLLAIDNFVDDLETRLSAARAGYLDNLNGHTPQTGDSYVRIGAPTGASVSADIAAVEAQTDDIGVAGVGLTAIPWNASWDTEVESEVTDALVAYDGPTNTQLDARTLLAANYATVANQTTLLGRIGTFTGSGVNTILGFLRALMRSDATTPSDVGGTYDDATDSIQAIRDRGDAAWTTGAGGSDRLLMVDTTIATLATQVSFTLTAGSADDDAYVNCTVVIEDVSTSTQKAIGVISAYTGASKTITLKYDPNVFTMAVTDKVYILAENSLKSTDQNRQLDVTVAGAAGIDWGNVENPTTAVDLSSTDIQLVDTTTANTDMRGTDSAALDSVATEARLAELDAANLPADLDTALTNQAAILNRIGAFTTGGVNTILGFFQALLRSDATTPSDVGGTYDDATDSLQAIRDRGDTSWTTGAGGTPPNLLQGTTIATLATQVSFTLTAGSDDDNAYDGAIAVVTDQSTSTQKAVGIISGYVGSTKTITLQTDPGIFVMEVGDSIDIVATDMASLVYTAARAGYLDNLNGHTPQSGDSYARLGSPAGASVSVDIAAIEAQTDDIGTAGAGLTGVPWNASWDAQVESEVTDALNGYDGPTNAEMEARTLATASYFDPAADTVATVTSVTNGVTVTTNNDKAGYSLSAAAIQSIWDALTSALVTVGSIGKLIVDNLDALISSRASSAEVGALNDISTAQVGAEVDSSLTAYDAPTKAEMDARTLLAASYATAAAQATMQADLDNPNQYKADVSALALEATLSALLTTQMTESYAANGVAPTPAQALFIIQQSIGDFSIAGTILTAKKIDGSTTAATYTLDDAVDPTSRTRAT